MIFFFESKLAIGILNGSIHKYTMINTDWIIYFGLNKNY